jgi:hypothetical protein
VNEIATIIEVIMADGTVQPMTVHKALDHGIDQREVGRRILAEMLDDVA